jgi:hypothetical protein
MEFVDRAGKTPALPVARPSQPPLPCDDDHGGDSAPPPAALPSPFALAAVVIWTAVACLALRLPATDGLAPSRLLAFAIAAGLGAALSLAAWPLLGADGRRSSP